MRLAPQGGRGRFTVHEGRAVCPRGYLFLTLCVGIGRVPKGITLPHLLWRAWPHTDQNPRVEHV